MSYTNKTTHYELPQYVATDIPSILTDLNGAYQTIDEAIYAVASKQGIDEADIVALQQAISTHTTEIGQLNTSLENEILNRQNADNALDTRVTDLENAPSAVIDTAMSDSSINAVQNRIIKAYCDSAHSALELEMQNLAQQAEGETRKGTITAGNTTITLTFTSLVISSGSYITVYTDTFGVNPVDVQYTTNSVTVEIASQANDVEVAVMIFNR